MGEPAEKRDDLSVYDVADYVNQMTGELSAMARGGGLNDLAETLERAQAQAASVMINHQRARG